MLALPHVLALGTSLRCNAATAIAISSGETSCEPTLFKHYGLAASICGEWVCALLLMSEVNAQTIANAKSADSPKPSAYIGGVVRDPLENYYDNTLVRAAAKTGNDLCHLWLYRDGTLINFDPNGAHTGDYQLGPVRADGKVPVCQYWDTPNMIIPKELQRPMGPAAVNTAPSQGATSSAGSGLPPGAGGAMVCRNSDYRTDCYRGVDPATLTEQELKVSGRTMGERFYNGMCYPLGPHNVGDTWFEDDDPLPGQLGLDKLFLLPGHQ